MTAKQTVGSLAPDGSSYVTITDGAGNLGVGVSVTVGDGSGPLTVDGTVSAAQSGTWTVQPGNTANTTAWKVDGSAVAQPVTDNSGSLTVDAPVGTPAFVRLSDGAAAITTLPVSLASVPSHAVTNAGTFAVQSAATLQAGSALVGKVGLDQTTPGTTNAVSVSQVNGVTALAGNGATGTGALRVSIASDSTGIVALPAAGTSVVGTKAAGTAAATSALIGHVYNSTIPTLTDGQQAASQADTTGAIRVTTEGGKATYSAIGAVAPVASAVDVFTITGSASKTVRVTRLQISGTATAASAPTFFLTRRSTANTGGTSGAQIAVPHDSTSAAATATVLTYTANPTAGTAVGSIRSQTITLTTPAGAIPAIPYIFDFTTRNSQGIVLRGTSQVLSVNLNSVTITGGSLTMDIEWTEE